MAGRRFLCYKDYRNNFGKFLKSLDSLKVDVMFINSAEISLNKDVLDGRKRKKLTTPPVPKTINYNCTLNVSKDDALSMFDDNSESMRQIIEILARGVERAAREKLAARDNASKL